MVKSWNVYTYEEIKTIREHADCTFLLGNHSLKGFTQAAIPIQ